MVVGVAGGLVFCFVLFGAHGSILSGVKEKGRNEGLIAAIVSEVRSI
jgi:hypothetical protein